MNTCTGIIKMYNVVVYSTNMLSRAHKLWLLIDVVYACVYGI